MVAMREGECWRVVPLHGRAPDEGPAIGSKRGPTPSSLALQATAEEGVTGQRRQREATQTLGAREGERVYLRKRRRQRC